MSEWWNPQSVRLLLALVAIENFRGVRLDTTAPHTLTSAERYMTNWRQFAGCTDFHLVRKRWKRHCRRIKYTPVCTGIPLIGVVSAIKSYWRLHSTSYEEACGVNHCIQGKGKQLEATYFNFLYLNYDSKGSQTCQCLACNLLGCKLEFLPPSVANLFESFPSSERSLPSVPFFLEFRRFENPWINPSPSLTTLMA